MLVTGSQMFLSIPGESRERVLHPGKVVESDADSFVAEFEEPVAPATGWDVTAYGEVRGKFYKQVVSVEEVEQTEPVPVIFFRRVSPPVPAESRGTYRVCTVTVGITARIGEQKDCPVVDVSADGLAAIIRQPLTVGAVIPFELTHEGKTLAGRVCLQSVKLLPDGRARYGFLVLDKTGPARRAMEQLSASLQRAQLRRLAGAA